MKLKSSKKDIKANRGITLIALVITIIVLLILAGITIASLTGNNAIISKSGEAKNASEIANEKEELEVEVIRFSDKRGNLDPDKVVNGLNKDLKNLKEATNTNGKFPVKVEYKNGHKYQITEDGDIFISVDAGDTAPSDSNAVYSSGDYTAIIPAGFTVSATESSIENGLVVTDGSENEWVWIPVSSEDLAKMYEECNTNNELLIENNITKVVTPYKSKSSTDVRSDLTRGDPNSTGWREPGLLASGSYDGNDNYRIAAGFIKSDGSASSLETMATKLKDDYKDMIDSIRENGGFYIGRYEIGGNISEPLVQKGKTVITNTNWYNLYKACKSFSSGKVESRMIWGCQWDQVCRFISTLGDNKVSSLDDSRSYGNYGNSEGAAATNSGTSNFDSTTGRNSAWKTNNIYDLAGNCWEWTQEACYTYCRASRGRRFQLWWFQLFSFLSLRPLHSWLRLRLPLFTPHTLCEELNSVKTKIKTL